MGEGNLLVKGRERLAYVEMMAKKETMFKGKQVLSKKVRCAAPNRIWGARLKYNTCKEDVDWARREVVGTASEVEYILLLQ